MTGRFKRVSRPLAAGVVVSGILLAVAQSATVKAAPQAAGVVQQGMPQTFERILLTAGRSTVLQTEFDITRIAITNPNIADAVAVQPREVLIDGKAPGTVSLIVWGAGRRTQYDVVVDPGVTTLQQTLEQLFPGEDIRVSVDNEAIILSGRVSSNAVMLRAAEVAGTTSSKNSVVNLLQVPGGGGSQQVMLQVRFAEVNRRAITELGANFFALRQDWLAQVRERAAGVERDHALRLGGALRHHEEADSIALIDARGDGDLVRPIAVEHGMALAVEDPGAAVATRAQRVAERLPGGAAVVDRERAGELARSRGHREARELRGTPRLAQQGQELGDAGQEGARRDEAPVLLDHEAELMEAQLEAALRLGYVDRGPAELARALPRLLGRAAVLDDVAHQRGRALAREHGPDRVDQLLLFRGDLEVHFPSQAQRVGGRDSIPSMLRATSRISRLSFSSSAWLQGSKGTSCVSQGIAAKWNTVVAPIKLMNRCGSVSGFSSPEATPSSITARNHSTGALPARTNGDTTFGWALAASRRIRRATLGRCAT